MVRLFGWSFARATVVCTVLTLLSGCTSLQDYVHNGFKVGPDYHYASAGGDKMDRRRRRPRPPESADTSRWWAAFHDPVLEALVTNAYSQNLTLKQAGMRIFEARMPTQYCQG